MTDVLKLTSCAVHRCRHALPQLLGLVFLASTSLGAEPGRQMRAGAAAIDITPPEFPVHVSGGFFDRTISEIKDRLHVRCLVLDDGQSRVAVATVDNCVIPREVFDEAKQLAGSSTGIPADRMLMSATHTHSAPALDGILGCPPNTRYRQWLPQRIAEAVHAANANLAPARIGWTVLSVPEHTHCRQWIRRPDRIDIDPFGNRTIRSMMHPGHQNPDYLGPAGPVDPDLSVVSVQSSHGRPIALLANYSMHYYGSQPLSADYFGAFSERIANLMGDGSAPGFVAMMSNGTSGDLHWMDYDEPKPPPSTHTAYAELLARKVMEACESITYHDWVPITMQERILTLSVRPIGAQQLEKARSVAAGLEGRLPKTLPELYAWEQVLLDGMPPTRELKLQALSIGELGIAAIPCEVFGITGLKIKARSPLETTFTIELANGYDGYVPPPAQHPLGGYTTWRARSSVLEVQAEPKIAEAVLELLGEIAGKPLREVGGGDYPLGDYPRAVLASEPLAYWRFNEFEGPLAADASGNNRHGRYEPGVVFYLEGPEAGGKADGRRINRAPHFAGGRMVAEFEASGDTYTLEMWFKNYLPADARDVTGCLLSVGPADHPASPCDHLAIGGEAGGQGKVLFHHGDDSKQACTGRAEIQLKTWNHVVLVRDGGRVSVYLNGGPAAELAAESLVAGLPGPRQLCIGGRRDGQLGFEGRIDEVAVYNRALEAQEISAHFKAAMVME